MSRSDHAGIDRSFGIRFNPGNLTKHPMKKLLSLIAVVSFATAGLALAASDKDTIMAAEKDAWQSIKDKKFDVFQKMLGADYRGVYGSGINKADKEMADVRQLDLKSFTLGEMDVVFIDKDAALVTYQITIEATQGGGEVSGKANVASLWKKEGDGWRVAFHTDVKAE